MHGMIDFTLAGFIERDVLVRPVRNSSDLWAKLPLGLRLPHYEKDGEMVPGQVRYFSVLAFGALARQIDRERLVIGDWVIVRVRDIRANVWVGQENKPRARVEMIAESIQFRPDRELVAAMLASLPSADTAPAEVG